MHLRIKVQVEIQGKLEVSSIQDKLRKTHLKWLGHVQKKAIEEQMRKSNSLEVTGTSRMKGRPKKTQIETFKKELKVLNLTDKIALDGTK